MMKNLVALVCWLLAASDAAAAAKNVILFLGDGMSLTTVTAARILDGQLRGERGEENLLSFERFPHVALSKTYTTDHQVADSAGTMTAIVTGVKTKSGAVSVDAEGRRLATLLELAEQRGMSTGIVTTSRLTHATPAACYGHAKSRGWESESDGSVPDLAAQLVAFPFEVALGGGRAHFLPKEARDPEQEDASGARKDGRDLTREWVAGNDGAAYVWSLPQFEQLDTAKVSRVLGLFSPSHMRYESERAQDRAGEPSLQQMTETAIEILSRNPKGYVLMVEGGRIDHAHHAGTARLALEETIELANAVATARRMTKGDETLIVVTADHSHTLTMSGYPARGNPILGKVTTPAGLARDAKGLPYTTLGYANGPGYRATGRGDLTAVDTAAPNYRQESAVPLEYEAHGGEDVPVYATGPGAHRVAGVMEQNKLFDVMRKALETR